MGFAADAYWHVGGFTEQATGEDVDLVRRFEAAWIPDPPRHQALSGHVGPPDRPRPSRIRRSPARCAGEAGQGLGMITTVGRWLDAGELDLPLPGSGRTLLRWSALADLCESDVVAGRLAEAHTDAVAILAELSGPPARPGRLWGVWGGGGTGCHGPGP